MEDVAALVAAATRFRQRVDRARCDRTAKNRMDTDPKADVISIREVRDVEIIDSGDTLAVRF